MMTPASRILWRRASYALMWLCLAGCSKSEPAPTPSIAASKSPLSAPVVAPGTVPAAPESLGPFKPPANNPTTPAKVELGRRLFFDESLSVDGTRSCYSCHRNEDGTGGHEPTAMGAKGL